MSSIYISTVSIYTGMCLGERRLVRVLPRLGWTKPPHHDTIMVEVTLVTVNGHQWRRLGDKQEL